ncbi:MAG: hypothetical protein IKF19_01055 [Bacilli bacterium]|nr:hypothetical protein [Bacilli bacterium]
MLIFPVVCDDGREIRHFKISFVGITEEKSKVYDFPSSEVIARSVRFSNSSFNNGDRNDIENKIVDFVRFFSSHIRHNNINDESVDQENSFFVVTAANPETKFCKEYRLDLPPARLNHELDTLYGKLINDLRKEIPGSPARGRYVSFKDLGLDKYFSITNIAKIKKIIDISTDKSDCFQLFEKEGVSETVKLAKALADLEYRLFDDNTLPVDSFEKTLKALSVINTRDYRNLKRYYDIAKTNTEVLRRIVCVFELVYNRKFTKNNFYVKEKTSNKYVENGKAA